MELNLNILQKLTLSQRMVLSAQILQMSSAELNDYLKELTQTNPLVEFEEKHHEVQKPSHLKEKLNWLDSKDEQNRYYYNEEKEDPDENWNLASCQNETLEEHIITQINTQHLDDEVRLAAEFAAKSIDKNGYLTENAQSISSFTGISLTNVEKALALLKTLDPPGVGASCLSECLEIQLLAEENPDLNAVLIVREHLDDLAKNKIKSISKSLGISVEDASSACRKIKTLNPKPSRGFSSKENLNYINPDAYIYKNKYDEYDITLNDYYSPSLRINSYYKTIINSENSEAKEYITEKLSQAEWVMKCIEKRNSTLMSTLQLIVQIQLPFFEFGTGNLRPMKLSDISQKLGLHESTISRAVRDKYIQCIWGIFPLTYFFSSALPKQSEKSDIINEVSQDSAKLKIKEIIDGEDKKKPLSDRLIAELLEKEGISISRRTVAKYRESMDIPGTSIRKTY